MKQSQKQPKKSLAEMCQERILTLRDAQREREEAARRALYQEQEDEVMRMTYGPNWRTQIMPWEEKQSPPESGVSMKAVGDTGDFYDDEEEDDYGKDHFRLKAS